MLISDLVVGDVPGWVRGVVRLFDESVAAAVGETVYLAEIAHAGLVDAKVKSRFVYEREAVVGMLRSEVESRLDACRWAARTPAWARRLLRAAAEPVIAGIAAAVHGKVTSVLVYARKPSAATSAPASA